MTAETAWLITDMLSDDAARGPGFGRESMLNLRTGPGQAAAVKTGTTSDFRDNWTIGYTPDIVVGVWVGNADNQPMRRISGVTGAAPLWREVLSGVLDMRGSRAFERPSNLVQVELCAESAAPASEACPAHRLEWLQLPLALGEGGGEATLTPLKIVFPDPGTVIVLDRTLPHDAQQVAIAVERTPPAGQIDVYVDDVHVGSRNQSGPVAWPPTIGHHVIRARSDEYGYGFVSGPVEVDVVPS
jgi:membrane peptidoglycan carboxypeptidase